MASPANRKEKEYTRKPRSVMWSSSWSYPTKIRARGLASPSARATMPTEKMPIRTRLFFSRPFSSPWFPAP